MFLLDTVLRNQTHKERRILPGGRKIGQGKKTGGWWRTRAEPGTGQESCQWFLRNLYAGGILC